MITNIDAALQKLAMETGGTLTFGSKPLSHRLAEALGWHTGSARTENIHAETMDGDLGIVRGFLGPQPAVVFVADGVSDHNKRFREAARFAYHSSVHWGVIADTAGLVVFNSHWIRNEEWFHLPEIAWSELDEHLGVFKAIAPQGISGGQLDHVAASIYEPDRFLMPVDDALVTRLDRWRLEALRYGRDSDGLDEDLHTLFAQLFVLRAVEDRRLGTSIPSLESVMRVGEPSNIDDLRRVFALARDTIQSELFADDRLDRFPDFVLAGIIRDLYVPEQLPRGSQRYNFSWLTPTSLGVPMRSIWLTCI